MGLRFGRCRVLEHLNRIGMNQAEYARRLGVSEPFVSKIVSGEKKLSLLKAKISANIFGCVIDDLYEWEHELDKKSMR